MKEAEDAAALREAVHSAIKEYPPDAFPDAAIVGWALVVEVMDTDGCRGWSTIVGPERTAVSWMAEIGMHRWAARRVEQLLLEDDEDDEDDE